MKDQAPLHPCKCLSATARRDKTRNIKRVEEQKSVTTPVGTVNRNFSIKV